MQRSPHNTVDIQERIREFKERFGRAPGPVDRIFFDTPSQSQVILQISGAMKAARIDPAFIYAFQKTGLLAVSENMDFLIGVDLQMWQDAVDVYRQEQLLLTATHITTGEPHAE
jgi:hypothetical protein